MEIIGSIASVLGAVLSAYVVWQLRQIRMRFIFKARFPELLKSLKRYARELSRNLNSFDESHREIDTLLTKCESTLKSLESKLSKEVKITATELITLISNRSKPLNKNNVWGIYNNLQALIVTLINFQKDIEWS